MTDAPPLGYITRLNCTRLPLANELTQPSPASPPPRTRHWWAIPLFVAKEVTAGIFWIYAILKLLFFDVDVYVIGKVDPNLQWLIDYKFVVLIVVISLIWLFTRNRDIIFWILFILCYPLILLLWRLPRFIWKRNSLVLGIAVLNLVVSFAKSFKFNLIALSVFLLSVLAIELSVNAYLLYAGIIIQPFLMLILIGRRIVNIFSRSTLFALYTKIVGTVTRDMISNKKPFALDPEIKALTVAQMDKNQLQQWGNALAIAVLSNKICYFLSSKFDEYNKSGFNVVFYLFDFLLVALLTVLSFAFVSHGIYRLDPSSYDIHGAPVFFDFLYYSFNSVVGEQPLDMRAATQLARGVHMLQAVFSLFLCGVLVTLLLNVRKQKEADEIESAARSFKSYGDALGTWINNEYKLSVAEAITELERIQGSLIKIIYFFSTH